VIEQRGRVDLPVRYIFKLRSNIVLDGDLALARMELDPYFSAVVHDISSVSALIQDLPQLRELGGLTALDSFTRENGVQALEATGPLALLPDLVRSLAFVQRIYCVTQDSDRVRAWLAGLQPELRAVIGVSATQEYQLIHAIPHYALYEYSAVVARRTRGVEAVRLHLDLMLTALKHASPTPAGARLAREALSARTTTAPLSHGLHYYKAKFFPRLARALLHSCARRLGEGPHRVLDPFVGSGTTCLESATLGIPSIGLDIDPLSVLISRTKRAAVEIDPELLHHDYLQTLDLFESLQSKATPVADEGRPIVFPSWLTKNRKMTPEIARELGEEISLLRAVTANCAPGLSFLFQVLVSDAIARRIRMRFLGTGVGRFSLTFARTPAPQIFARSLERFVRTVAAMDWLRRQLHLQLAEAQVLQADARRLPDGLGDFDILLTSPPYLPASSGRESYARARAPSLIALGIKERDEVDNLVDDSIGSMDGDEANLEDLTAEGRHLVDWLRRDPLRSIKAEPTARYLLDMRQAFAEMERVLRPGGLAVVVSGKCSTFYNYSTREVLYVARSAELLADEAQRSGLELQVLHDVQLYKANKNARPRSLDDYYETLIVLQKPTC
jgi:SAM-dependent methyltransferase